MGTAPPASGSTVSNNVAAAPVSPFVFCVVVHATSVIVLPFQAPGSVLFKISPHAVHRYCTAGNRQLDVKALAVEHGDRAFTALVMGIEMRGTLVRAQFDAVQLVGKGDVFYPVVQCMISNLRLGQYSNLTYSFRVLDPNDKKVFEGDWRLVDVLEVKANTLELSSDDHDNIKKQLVLDAKAQASGKTNAAAKAAEHQARRRCRGGGGESCKVEISG